jgi:hypothetical protein
MMLALGVAGSAAGAATVEFAEPWSNTFGGRQLACHVRVVGTEAMPARVLWRLAAGNATLARDEQNVRLQPGQAEDMAMNLRIPETREGAVLNCTLAVSLLKADANEELAAATREMHVFPESPFLGRQRWLKALDILLFDPEKRTQRVFENAGVPFETVANADTVGEQDKGFLVIGAGTSFRDYRALARQLVAAAERGRHVLVLAPGGGDFTLPEPRRLVLRGEDVIHELDKRLDDAAWPADGKTRHAAVRLTGGQGPVTVEVTDGKGWPWMEMEFAAGGRVVVCGFAVVDKWDATPTPRFLLSRILEYMAGTEARQGGKG